MRGIELVSRSLRSSLRLTPAERGSKPPKTPRHRQDFARVPPPFSPGMLLLTAIALAVTGGAFFLPAVPLWCAGLPLLAAIAAWSFTTRFVLALCFFFWPALVATLGLTTLGHPALTVSLATALAILALPLLMAWLGVVPVSLALLALPTFPANPVPALVDALPGPVSLTGLGLILTGLLVVERITLPLTRIFLTVLFCIGLGLGHLFASIFADRGAADHAQATWIEHPVPAAITERAAWIRIRDSLPQGSEAILGENLLAQGDLQTLAFWRQAARERNLTLWIGTHARNGRGMLLHLSPETTSIDPEPVAAARYGIPGITGTWGRMPPLDDKPGEMEDIGAGVDWLFCYEALLPHAWAPLLIANRHPDQPGNRPIVVLASDRWLGPLPFHITRRKVARAMAGMAGRPVHFAETGRTLLLRTPEGDTNELE